MGYPTPPPVFDIEQTPSGVLRLWSRAKFAGDGEIVRLNAVPLRDGKWSLTDGAAAVMHAEAFGAGMDGKKIAQLARLMPRDIDVGQDGELTAGPIDPACIVQEAMRLLTAVLVFSHAAQPGVKVTRASFDVRVEHLLAAEYGGKRISRRKRFAGGSGHLIEVPFVLDAASRRPKLVTPIGIEPTGLFDWGKVYGIAGKFSDLKQAGFGEDQRFVIVDDDARSHRAIGQVETILAECANVLPFSRSAAWKELLQAA